MNSLKIQIRELRSFLILWSTQSLSALGSAMTSYALIIWSYQQQGSALTTALLSVCSYTPYIVMSIFAGALSDKWNKKVTMLVSDSFAALCTLVLFLLMRAGKLEIWHLYCLNALNGLMNTIQQPAADVTISLLVKKKYYQKVSGMRSFSNSLVSILTPVIATAVFTMFNMQAVFVFDLLSFLAAFFSLLLFIKIPDVPEESGENHNVLESVKSGLQYLKHNRGILDLILFLSAINLVASVYNAALPAMLLSREGGGNTALGILNAVSGTAMLIGSILTSVLPAPRSRVRVICNTLLMSMCTENFFLAIGRSVPIWCVGAILGWICIPFMNANMDVLFRSRIPIGMQGRIYSVRNTLQFFTIPVGYLLGGLMVDNVFEPFMASRSAGSFLTALFGSGKGSGAAFLFFMIAVAGVIICLIFRKDPHIWKLDE
ncbi:MFS transporter [Anaerolentibacter hominis]|uniref:MFS transporter n=1 Tax=Anaerolentibacter hominis TaxID=3079009 RepID=UPI0031B8172A